MTTRRIAELEAQVTRWEKQFKQWHSERVGLEYEVTALSMALHAREAHPDYIYDVNVSAEDAEAEGWEVNRVHHINAMGQKHAHWRRLK